MLAKAFAREATSATAPPLGSRLPPNACSTTPKFHRPAATSPSEAGLLGHTSCSAISWVLFGLQLDVVKYALLWAGLAQCRVKMSMLSFGPRLLSSAMCKRFYSENDYTLTDYMQESSQRKWAFSSPEFSEFQDDWQI